jgi:hypothetical protein
VDNPEVRVTIPFWYKPSGCFCNLTAGDLNATSETDQEIYWGPPSIAAECTQSGCTCLVSNTGPDIRIQIKRSPGLPQYFKKSTGIFFALKDAIVFSFHILSHTSFIILASESKCESSCFHSSRSLTVNFLRWFRNIVNFVPSRRDLSQIRNIEKRVFFYPVTFPNVGMP